MFSLVLKHVLKIEWVDKSQWPSHAIVLDVLFTSANLFWVTKPCMLLQVWIIELESVNKILLERWHIFASKDTIEIRFRLPFFLCHFWHLRQSFFTHPFLQKKYFNSPLLTWLMGVLPLPRWLGFLPMSQMFTFDLLSIQSTLFLHTNGQ